jgi:perosamine synthetase
VVEDAAHALPASFRGARIGTISDLTAFSFYATKTITTGEGGMLTTNNDAYAERATKMRLHGIGGDAWKRYSREGTWFYEVLHAGYKLNLCDLLGALGLAQLHKCDDFWEQRRRIARMYSEQLARIEELEIPSDGAAFGEHSWHLYILRIKSDSLSINRNEVIEELRKAGVGTSVHFIPLHLHPFYSHCYGYQRGDFPNAEDAFSRCISLPIYPGLRDEQVVRIIGSVQQIVKKNRRRVLVASS